METVLSVGASAPALAYHPHEIDQIVSVIRNVTEPEHIILFGSLAGATPFSEVAAYDLLVVTPRHPPMEWDKLRSYLKIMYPSRARTIPFINLYLHSLTASDFIGTAR